MKHSMPVLMLIAILGTVGLAQRVTVEFWHAFGDPKRGGWIQAKAEAFNKANPNINVVPTFKGSYPEILQAATLAARQGKPPALVQMYEIGSQFALDSGIFQPVSNVGPIDTADYIKPVLNYYTIGGKVNSIPFNSSSPVLYFNKDLMKKAGLDPAKPPMTFGELTAACGKIAAANLGVKCFGMSLNGWFFEQWMAEQGALLANNSNGRKGRATEVLLTSEPAKRIVSWLKEMNDKGYYTYTGKLEDWDGSDAIFTDGKVVFHITSTADIVNINDAAKKTGFEMGVGFLPIPDGVKRNGVVIGGASLWISKGIPKEQAEAALKFALYMTNTDNMAEWHKITGYYPVRLSSIERLKKEGWLNAQAPQLVAFNQLLETIPNEATAGALIGPFQQIRRIVEETIQKVFSGTPVDAALNEAKTRADAALKEYNASIK
ncbi:ABC transporter substrate-binding protein [Calidithermus timidus]|uniref:ABC transporter substrate-binding protein n=1 Tax=Calidithermus timidus TaxID=307124 RepID=UPI00047714DC|nr:ABC transporter substrate-binding protein [Calidithermus timidus]